MNIVRCRCGSCASYILKCAKKNEMECNEFISWRDYYALQVRLIDRALNITYAGGIVIAVLITGLIAISSAMN